MRTKRKVTGEAELFREIAAERVHSCARCGSPVRDLSPANFHHTKTKGSRPDLRLEKTNIEIVCRACHDQAHGRQISVPIDL